MTAVTLTCDRQDGLVRVAVWQGGNLRDLYLDLVDQPDMTGAVVMAKVERLSAGRKTAWCEADLSSTIYVDNPGEVRSGNLLALRITATARQGKAWRGVITDRPEDVHETGILIPPPRPWERALADLKDVKPASLTFADQGDYAEGKKLLESRFAPLLHVLQPVAKNSPHSELDEIIDKLRESVVALPGGGTIVIEETEALVAIDVNGGENANALAVNLQAVKETARQIRWRNLSGIIMVDAMKMKLRPDNAKLLNAAKRAVADDSAKVQVFGMTKLGLLEMTRQRWGLSVPEIMGKR